MPEERERPEPAVLVGGEVNVDCRETGKPLMKRGRF